MNLFVHLPFSTLRYDQASDHRQLSCGKYLRRSVEIPHLQSLRTSTTSADQICWIHETQISMHISVVDPSCWTAYVFEDTFYKQGQEAERFADFLQDTSTTVLHTSVCLDALAGAVGSRRSDGNITRNPLDYFVKLFEAYITKAYLEWEAVVEELEKGVKRRVSHGYHPYCERNNIL